MENGLIQKGFVAPGMASLGPERRASALPKAEIIRLTETASNPLLRGVLLLWNDHLGSAHTIAQEVESADGSLLHAIMHRREPDYSNAKYWFRRVGRHPVYETLGIDPLAFVDSCEAAARNKFGDSEVIQLREIQRSEFAAFLKHLGY